MGWNCKVGGSPSRRDRSALIDEEREMSIVMSQLTRIAEILSVEELGFFSLCTWSVVHNRAVKCITVKQFGTNSAVHKQKIQSPRSQHLPVEHLPHSF